MMNHDAFASNIPPTARLASAKTFLESKRNEIVRKEWMAEEQQPARIALMDQSYKDWGKLTIPSSDALKAITSRLPNSWAIQFTFTLASSYLSKGIEAFDILDNPIIRDKVFEVPIVPASSWKGGLHAAAMMRMFDENITSYADAVKQAKNLKEGQKAQWDARLQKLVRIFGVDRDIEHDYSAGQLHCLPTGFKATRCEVINPHDRARRVGLNPILLECVPAGEKGIFTLLYIPFGAESDPALCAQDLILCAKAIQALLLEWGIGAKKSSGNGLAKDSLQNSPNRPKRTLNV